MWVGLQHFRCQTQPSQMGTNDGQKLRQRLAEVTRGKVYKGLANPAQWVQHAHRALHDVGQVTPSYLRDLPGRRRQHIDRATSKAELGATPHDSKRGTPRGSNRLDQRRLAAARLARKPIDL